MFGIKFLVMGNMMSGRNISDDPQHGSRKERNPEVNDIYIE